jgi:hypothetical protein
MNQLPLLPCSGQYDVLLRYSANMIYNINIMSQYKACFYAITFQYVDIREERLLYNVFFHKPLDGRVCFT